MFTVVCAVTDDVKINFCKFCDTKELLGGAICKSCSLVGLYVHMCDFCGKGFVDYQKWSYCPTCFCESLIKQQKFVMPGGDFGETPITDDDVNIPF